jgi:inorganic pyrophosphatase
MKIITAGSRYLDIDAYAGIIAYAELLRKQGMEAKAVSTATPNESVPATIRSWPVQLETVYTPSLEDTFTLIDISTPGYFDTFVDHSRIDTVVDHHPGFETYWQKRIGEGANIEPIGAACTQVYEYWKNANLVDQMSQTSARLLICGILDNTLNFGAKITTKRDHDAYEDLMHYTHLPEEWPAQYFGEIQAAIDKDPVSAIQNDTKTIQFASHGEAIHVGQFAVWNAEKVLNAFQQDLQVAFDKDGTNWFINIISIGNRKSYFVCSNPDLRHWLSRLLAISFNGSLAIADRLWLRKEIIQRDINSTR